MCLKQKKGRTVHVTDAEGPLTSNRNVRATGEIPGEAREEEDSSKREEARVLNNNNETAAITAGATAATTAEAEAVNRGKIGLNPTSS